MTDPDAGFELQPAPLDKRLIAALIDFVIGAFLSAVPILGGVAAATYWVLRDGLEVEFMNHRSIGKAIMKIRPVRPDGSHTDIDDSIRRNWMFAPAALIPFLFYSVIGAFLVPPMILLVLVITGIEIYLISNDVLRQRLGDKVADTVVVEVSE
jgi:uncharacterized RDD family membrane protein YckC